jgi:hypothetical protein
MRSIVRLILITIAFGISLSCLAEDRSDPEEARLTSSSRTFEESFDSSVDELVRRGFDSELQGGHLGSEPAIDLGPIVKAIEQEAPIPEVDRVVKGGDYDVVLQPGHYLRTTGRTGATGARVTERALVAYIVAPMAEMLRKKGLKVLVLPADPQLMGALHTKIFLAVHAEGSVKPCSAKPSLGYDPHTSPMAMHAVGWALGQALGYQYERFQKDNFNSNVSNYYMYRQIQAVNLKGLLEVGEVTCPATEDALIAAADKISNNLARAMIFVNGQ